MEEWRCHRCEILRSKSVRATYVRRIPIIGWHYVCARCFRDMRDEAAHRVKSTRVYIQGDHEFDLARYWRKTTTEERRHWLHQLWELAEATPRPCEVCGRKFAWIGRPQRRICSDECAREKRNRAKRVQHEERPCAVCGEAFVPKRADAVCCSGKCRTRAYRRRIRER